MSDTEHRIAVLIDCDNASPESAEHALRVVANFGRVVGRRGYGNHQTVANKWHEALVRLSFTPCLQYQYASGKNTSDIALALDTLEAMFDRRADTFCLIASDSDFAYRCRKLRERGATECGVGESKTSDAVRNASDQFFEWAEPEPVPPPVAAAATASAPALPFQQSHAVRTACAESAPQVRRRRGRVDGRRRIGRQGDAFGADLASEALRSAIHSTDEKCSGPTTCRSCRQEVGTIRPCALFWGAM
jgi:uncharacterized protein (TIGR00288 family)